MVAYILTMVILASVPTTLTVTYVNKERCEAALKLNREKLTQGTVILATCTQQ